MKKSTALAFLYASFLLITLLLFGYAVKQGHWLQTDLRALLPQEQGWSSWQAKADQHQEEQLNQQVILLVGHSDAQTAFTLNASVAQQWRESGLFAQVNERMQPDIDVLRNEIKHLRLVSLSKDIRQQLLTEPQVYFQQYAEQLINPFTQSNLLSLEQDWLGFGRFVLPQAQTQSRIQWNATNGMLYVTENDQTWVLLRGVLRQSNLINPSVNLPALLVQNRLQIEENKGQMRAAGAALFAAHAKVKAEQESTFMSILGISLTLLLLLFTFRTFRVLWLFLPILAGMLSGVTATVYAFGQIHILTPCYRYQLNRCAH